MQSVANCDGSFYEDNLLQVDFPSSFSNKRFFTKSMFYNC